MGSVVLVNNSNFQAISILIYFLKFATSFWKLLTNVQDLVNNQDNLSDKLNA